MSINTQGYAIRRNSSCGDEEVTCHKTWENDLAITMACCPHDSHCNDSGQPNTICCPNGLNCTKEIESKPPTCADQRWNMYDKEGAFCCEQDQSGFYIENSIWVGCYLDSSSVNGNYIGLPVLSTGSLPTSTATSSSSTSFATATSTTSAAASTGDSTSTNTGAIAGGIIGGLVGVALIFAALFFLLRSRKTQENQDQQPLHSQPHPLHDSSPSVLTRSTHPSELEEQNNTPVEAVLEYPPQREYPAYPMPVYEYYNQSQHISPEYSRQQYSQYAGAQQYPQHPGPQQYAYSSPSEYNTAYEHSAHQLHELPTDRNQRVDYK